jgi:aspartate kinase
VIASVLGAKVLEIWTDVDGILTTDPKICPNAMLVKEVTYDEASELATFGAKVLHPKTIYPAVSKRIPVYVLNTFNPSSSGTLISFGSPRKKVVKAIAFRKNIMVVNIKSNRMLGVYGYLAKVFDIFNMFQTSVDLVSTSEVSISLTIDDSKNLNRIVKELSEISTVEILDNCSIVSVIGEGLKDSTTIASRIFNALKNIKIYMVSMGASDINFSFVVRQDELEKTVNLLHNEFFGNSTGLS